MSLSNTTFFYYGQYIPPSASITITPTVTITPSRTPTPSITPTTTVTLTPTRSITPTVSPTPSPFIYQNVGIVINGGGESIIFEGVPYYSTTVITITAGDTFKTLNTVPQDGFEFVQWVGTSGVTFLYPLTQQMNVIALTGNQPVVIENIFQVIASPTVTPTITPTVTPTITITPSNTLTPTVTPQPTTTPSNTITPSITPTITPSNSITPSITPTNSITPSITPTNSITPTITPSVTQSVSVTNSVTPTITPTSSIRIYSNYDFYFDQNGLINITFFNGTTCLTQTINITGVPLSYYNTYTVGDGTMYPVNGIFLRLAGTYSACGAPPPTPTTTPTITPTISITSTVTPSVTPTKTPEPSITPSVTVSKTITPSITISPTNTPSITVSPTNTPSITITPSVTKSPAAPTGFTYYLTNCSQDALEDCYYRGNVGGVFVKSVQAGDTIVLPAGSATWGAISRPNGGRMWFILPITIKGQGDTTIISIDNSGYTYTQGVINLWSQVKFADMKIIGAPSRPVTPFTFAAYDATYGQGARITNITYEGGGGSSYFLYGNPGSYGLVDNCRFTGATGNTELMFTRGSTNAWQLNPTFGTSNNIFIEDCVFNGSGYVSDANSNARMVVRFCTINGAIKVDGHGVASNTPARSVRNMEVYNNTWTNTSLFWTAIEMRGGECRVFNNTANGSGGWFYLTDYGYLAAWPNFGNVIQTPINYPVTDQIGVGKDPKVAGSGPTYVWGNRQANAPWVRTSKLIPQSGINLYRTQTGNPTATYDERTVIQANRDFYADSGFDTTQSAGVSVGTYAQMLAFTSPFVKYGWWATDQGTWNQTPGGAQGKLYTWDGSSWVANYEPYQYPHPLRG